MAFGLFYKTGDELEFSPYYSRAPIYILDLEKEKYTTFYAESQVFLCQGFFILGGVL